MITRLFLDRLAQPDPNERAIVVGPLVRAYMCQDLSQVSREEIGAGLCAILDDPSPIVRKALALALANETGAPHHLALPLARDQAEIATPILLRCDALSEYDLVELIGEGDERARTLIARRVNLTAPLSAALIEVSGARPCLALLDNPTARILPVGFARLAERHAHTPAVRAALLRREDLPAYLRQGLTTALCDALGEMDMVRAVVRPERAKRVIRETWERVTVALATSCGTGDRRALITHLAASERLSAGLILRALIIGNIGFFEDVLAFLSRLPARRAARLIHDRRGPGFRVIYERAGLPESAYQGFRIALSLVLDAVGEEVDFANAVHRHQLILAIQAEYEAVAQDDLDGLRSLFMRLADEAAREEAQSVFFEDAAAA